MNTYRAHATPKGARRLLSLSLLFCLLLYPFASARALLTTPWLEAKEHAGVVYFLYAAPAAIERYDLAAETWLADITLAEAPTAFAVDAAGIYIAFGRRTSRFSLAGTGETHLFNTSIDVTGLFTLGDVLYAYYQDGYDAYLMSSFKASGILIDAVSYWDPMQGFDVAPGIRMVFARSVGYSPSDILKVVLNPDGTLGAQSESPYHGDFPGASRTYVFPNEVRVADDSGIVYNTSDLTYSNSLAGSFDDLAFYGDVPVVLRGNALVAYSNTFLETGRYDLVNSSLKTSIYGEKVYSFYAGGGGMEVEIVPVATLEPADPGLPVNPNGLAYAPDDIVQGNDVLYILSRGNLSVFRWSIPERRYLPTIPLVEAPSHMAYSEVTNRLYLAYASGKVTHVLLDTTTAEAPFVNLPQSPRGLATAGEYLFACDNSGAWVSHWTFHPNGTLTSQTDWRYFSNEYVWNQVNRKMYFFRDDTSPNDLLWEDIDVNGVIGPDQDSPYHSSAGIIHPIRVKPDGSIVVLGSGRIYDAITLAEINALSNNIADAAWHGGTLYTLREIAGYTQIQEWTAGYAVAGVVQVEGVPLGLFPTDEGLLFVMDRAGVPDFTLWSPDLVRIYPYEPHRDFNGDGLPDFFWRNHATGRNYLWYMNGTLPVGGAALMDVTDMNWVAGAVDDFNVDGKPDILWRNIATGQNFIWYCDGASITGGQALSDVAGADWIVAGTGDFNRDGYPDVVWRHPPSGSNHLWYMKGSAKIGDAALPGVAGAGWVIAGIGYFNGDRHPDILWRDTATGVNYLWYMAGPAYSWGAFLPSADPAWSIDLVEDFNDDGRPDIIWRNYSSGADYIWYMNDRQPLGGAVLPGVADLSWKIEN